MFIMHVFYIFALVLVQCKWACAAWKSTTEIKSSFREQLDNELTACSEVLLDVHTKACGVIRITSTVNMFIHPVWGRNNSVGSAGAPCPQRRGFDAPLGTFSGRGDFSLGVNMGSNSIPPKTPSDESINRGLVCAYMHFIARTQKILTFMS